ncbi:MAG TPA: hypothetical protein VND91_07110, partial [Candidatus Saccharimonadia bacterium]|nr:hypothetical protein [Candidatus Saccharimonadia bacterium]
LASAANAADDAPSLELLLHLAEFSDAEGRPIDPESVEAAMESIDPSAAGESASPAPASSATGRKPESASSAETPPKPRSDAQRPPRASDEPD